MEFSFLEALKCCPCLGTTGCTWTLLSVVILHVYFIWKSISDMKYLYTRNHLNYLKFAGIMAFLMKSRIIVVKMCGSKGKRLSLLAGARRSLELWPEFDTGQ